MLRAGKNDGRMGMVSARKPEGHAPRSYCQAKASKQEARTTTTFTDVYTKIESFSDPNANNFSTAITLKSIPVKVIEFGKKLAFQQYSL